MNFKLTKCFFGFVLRWTPSTETSLTVLLSMPNDSWFSILFLLKRFWTTYEVDDSHETVVAKSHAILITTRHAERVFENCIYQLDNWIVVHSFISFYAWMKRFGINKRIKSHACTATRSRIDAMNSWKKRPWSLHSLRSLWEFYAERRPWWKQTKVCLCLSLWWTKEGQYLKDAKQLR